MKVVIVANEKEIADLILRLQGQQEIITDEVIKKVTELMSEPMSKGGVIPL